MTDKKRRQSFVSHLECSLNGERYEHDQLHGLSSAGAPLLVRYDLEAIGRKLNKSILLNRAPDLWKWRELLPLDDETVPVDLGETITPLIQLDHPAHPSLPGDVLVKDEGRLPTGSFKARGMAVAVTMAKQFGISTLAVPTAGNAGSAAAAYGAAAGMDVVVLTPDDTPEVTVREIAYHGAKTYRVNGLINECGRIIREGTATVGWHDLSTLAEPYRLEGKKTMGLELAEQLGWKLPDVIYYPTGGGTGFIGMWKAFQELQALGFLDCALPRMVAVQTEGCSPIRKAFNSGLDEIAEAWSPVTTEIHGVRVPKPLGGRLILQVIRNSRGHATSVSDSEVFDVRDQIARQNGIHLCPEGAACFAAYCADVTAQKVSINERIVIFNTANGLKTSMPSVDNKLDCDSTIDYRMFN